MHAVMKNKAFTLIELIIVVVIIGILALVAIPRYFANVAKAQRSRAFANLDAIRQAQLAYYATYGTYKDSFPITVVVDGDNVVNISNLSDTAWTYSAGGESSVVGCAPDWSLTARKQPGDSCYYWMCMSSGSMSASTCTP